MDVNGFVFDPDSFKPGTKVRILPTVDPQRQHQHYLHDYKTDKPFVYHMGPECWICEAAKKFQKKPLPWYMRLRTKIKETWKIWVG